MAESISEAYRRRAEDYARRASEALRLFEINPKAPENYLAMATAYNGVAQTYLGLAKLISEEKR